MRPYYDADGITIYHADCRDVLPSLAPVDLVLTDPPYGVGKATWDTLPDFDWLSECRRLARVVAFTPGVTHLFAYPAPAWTFCWARPASTQRNRVGGFNNWEPFLIYGDPKLDVDLLILPHEGHQHEAYVRAHPCAKPVRLLRWLAGRLSPAGPVLDPFMGSGTTLRAAKDLGLPAIGIEVEERYCEIAANRLRQSVLPLASGHGQSI